MCWVGADLMGSLSGGSISERMTYLDHTERFECGNCISKNVYMG